MIVYNAQLFAETYATLQRIADSPHESAAWARSKLAEIDRGVAMSTDDVEAAESAERKAFPVSRIAPNERDVEFAEYHARRAVPIADLIGVKDPPEPRPRARRPMPIP